MSNTAPAQGTRDRVAELANYLIDSSSGISCVHIDAKGVDMYFSTLEALEKDRACKHIDRDTIDVELGILASDLLHNQREMRNRNVYQERLSRFFSVITRQLSTYEVIFRTEGIKKFPSEPITIGNVAFQEFSQQLARLNRKDESICQKAIEEFIGKPVSIVKVEAGSAGKAVEHARKYCERALNTLRFCIGASHWYWPVPDIELLQRLGEHYLIRLINPETSPLARGWQMGFRQIERDISERSAGEIRLFLERLTPLYDGSIKGKFRDRLLRSIDWISTSIIRENHDHKIIDLCTAMESVLTTKDEKKKGEDIAVRSLLLSMTLTKKREAIPDIPETIYKLYGKRSEIVHGSSLGICVNSDYTTLRLQAANIVLSIIELVRSETRITRLKHLFEFLESRERLEKAIRRLENQPDKDAAKLAKYAKERLDEPP